MIMQNGKNFNLDNCEKMLSEKDFSTEWTSAISFSPTIKRTQITEAHFSSLMRLPFV